ncbi:MAG: hypothetical protein ACK4FK_10870 [Ferrovibrio sp.]|uniref:hypothetical protein n=1 Tax=Ferrovibrio sp. TaxID=1917215 RepID=UPI00391CD5BD
MKKADLKLSHFVHAGEIAQTVVPAAFAPGIGVLCIYCGHIESIIDRLLWFILKVDRDGGETITSGITSISRKIKLLKQLAKVRGDPKFITDLTAALDGIKTTFNHRNYLVHGGWEFGHVNQTTAGKFTFNADRKQKRVAETYDEARILSLIADAARIHSNLYRLLCVVTGFIKYQDDEQKA